ncbi:MAG: hypothetical protein BGO14_02720 [Chlamydiales bacterium 38-26]|nr:hypothetical protein [Chlamydiales bacterium]OJV09264.1 MAG: hypothetical protein BGO14_02720 [Chlamydiales bacterium 38-26]
MAGPIDNNFKHLYQDPNIHVSDNPQAAPPKPFNINATQKGEKTKKDFKQDKEKKKDKNGKEIDDEEEENKPLPRPMGL